MFGSSIPLLLESNGGEIFLKRVRHAIDTALQPIADIRTGTAHGFEALVRKTEALGFASIGQFFAFAERLGVRSEIDTVLLGKAAEKLVAAEQHFDALLFVNLDRLRAAQIDDIHSISGQDLEITKRNDKVVVSFSYSREIPLAGPAYLVYRFKESTN